MFVPERPPTSFNGHGLSARLARRFAPEQIARTNADIARLVIGASHFVRGTHFTVIAPADLSRMFDLYDGAYFDGQLRHTVNEKAGGRLGFRLAPRMTRAGGKTFRVRRPIRRGLTKTTETSYEIAISSRLLFLSFDDASRPATVCGVPCADRLSALQRIMEHEMLHLAEMLVWDRSSCTAERFKTMSRNLFGHAASTHELITPAERAVAKFDLRIGDAVTFTFDGRTLRGMLNRINRRATVLVESPAGQRYTNGRRYEKFYIPLGMLKKSDA